MNNRIREYFIGDYLRKTDDVFEKARAIMLLQFSLMFCAIFILPLTSEIILGFYKAVIVHSFAAIILLSMPFLITRMKSIDAVINFFFLNCFIISSLVFMVLNPAKIDPIGVAWSMFFLFLSTLLQRGKMRILFAGFLLWLPLLYIIINTLSGGQFTVDFLEQKGIENPPIFLLFIPMVLGIYAYWSHTFTIDMAKKTIVLQKQLIEEKNKNITDSIVYAKRLQEAILPPNEHVKKYLKDIFIFYKPKDVVAGDFYWFEKSGDKLFIAAADCTGHGVPGAMVSVVCSGALNRAVKEYQLTDTGKILDKARELVIETFEKSKTEVKDGMDISLLSIDFINKKIQWSGANNNLWMIHNNDLTEIKADKQPIGKTEQTKNFTSHSLDLINESIFYLFTDGFSDQFGGIRGKKLKNKRLAEFLKSIHLLSPDEQNKELNKKLDEWKGDLEQVDDICIIGIKI